MAHFVYHFRTNDSKLFEMLALRERGWSYAALAQRYECPKLTIRWLVRKYGLGENVIFAQFTIKDYLSITASPQKENQQLFTEEPIRKLKTYAEYLKEDQERKKKIWLNSRSPTQ